MRFAFVFPGQGSQAISMLNDMADLPVVKNTIIEASDALGVDLLGMMQNGPAEDLNLTVNTHRIGGFLSCLGRSGRQNAIHHGRTQFR